MITSESEAKAYIERLAGASCVERLARLETMLVSENDRQNLVSPRSLSNIWIRHFADSAQLQQYIPEGTGTLGDFGSGAGFPGLVLALMNPNVRVMLIEPRALRVQWLNRAITELSINNCKVEPARAENVVHSGFDVITARALAKLSWIIPKLRSFSELNTVWVLPKGATVENELASIAPKMRKLFHVKQSLTSLEGRIIIGKGIKGLAE